MHLSNCCIQSVLCWLPTDLCEHIIIYRGPYIVLPQVCETNKYMLNFKQMSCSKRKEFREKLELSVFYKELKHIHCFQMSLLT